MLTLCIIAVIAFFVLLTVVYQEQQKDKDDYLSGKGEL